MGGFMKKLLLLGMISVAGFMAFAGDAAAFVDLGISQDGRTYAFAEYGKTDKTFQGYAEIYTVDIEKNDFVDGEVFRTNPSTATTSKSGKAVYEELYEKASWKLRKYDFKPASVDNLLYVRDDKKEGESEIVFKDFEGSTNEQSVYYHIKLAKTVFGSGEGLRSSFFITIEVPIATLCPCSKAISDYGAHNQRGLVKVKLLYKDFFWIEDVIQMIEDCASTPLYTLLKRKDEKHVTEYAYDNPRFVEDVVREVYLGLKKMNFTSGLVVIRSI